MSLRKFNSHHAKKVSSENTTEENSFHSVETSNDFVCKLKRQNHLLDLHHSPMGWKGYRNLQENDEVETSCYIHFCWHRLIQLN